MESIIEIIDGQERSYTISYEYDSQGNIIREYDSAGCEIRWEYEEVTYDCLNFECLDDECLELDTSLGECSYSQLVSRTVGNYKVDIGYDGDTTFYVTDDGEPYFPEVYDDEGLYI